jgi:hypothetical protein
MKMDEEWTERQGMERKDVRRAKAQHDCCSLFRGRRQGLSKLQEPEILFTNLHLSILKKSVTIALRYSE